MKIKIITILSAIVLTSCTVTEDQASQLSTLVEVAGVLMSAEDAAKLDALQRVGEVIITVEEAK